MGDRGDAVLLLLLALLGTAGELAAVDGVEAGVVLDVARAGQGGVGGGEGVAVDGEGAVGAGRELDGRGGTAEGSGEGLDVARGTALVLVSVVVVLVVVAVVVVLVVVASVVVVVAGVVVVIAGVVVVIAAVAVASTARSNSSLNLVNGGLLNQEVLGKDAAVRVVGVVAGVSSSGGVANLARGKSAGEEGLGGVTADGSDLDGKVQDGLLVFGRLGRGRVLDLRQGGDLGVDGLDGRAELAGLADGQGVPLQGAEDERVDHAGDVVVGLGVGEGLVGNDLLQTVEVGGVNLVRSLGGGCVTQKGKDGGLDLQGVVVLEKLVHGQEVELVRVLLGDLSSGEAREGEKSGGDEELHVDGCFVFDLENSLISNILSCSDLDKRAGPMNECRCLKSKERRECKNQVHRTDKSRTGKRV